MDAEANAPRQTFTVKLLACLSVAMFWLVPFSPLVAIAAVKATRDTVGWPRRMATAGAWLSIATVTYFTVGTAWVIYLLIWNRAVA